MMGFQLSTIEFYLYNFAELTLALYLLMYISYAVVFGGSKNFSYPTLLSSMTLFTMLTFIFILIEFGNAGSSFSFVLFNGALNITFFSFVFRILLLVSCIALLYISRDYLSARGIVKYEYDLLIVFSIFSLIILGCSEDFLVVYLAIELQSLGFYVLATFQRDSEFSTEAGLKYFVLGAFSSGLLLFGFTLVYVTFGSTLFEAIGKLSSSTDGLLAF
jgi:NADH-quinone oxidoreductase subunit N